MKSFIKLIFMMCVLLLSLNGCGSSTSNDDNTYKYVSVTRSGCLLLTDNLASSYSNSGITTISKSSYNSKYIGCSFQLYSFSPTDITNPPFNIFLKNSSNTTIATFTPSIPLLPAYSYFPTMTTSRVVSCSETNNPTLISNLSTGTYYLVFSITGGSSTTIILTITD